MTDDKLNTEIRLRRVIGALFRVRGIDVGDEPSDADIAKSLDELWMGQHPKTGEVMIGAWPSNMLEYNRRLIAKAEGKDPDIDNRLKDESGDILF